MELSKDTLIYMAMMLDLPDILALCKTNSKINQIICQNERFWLNKIKRDYPQKELKPGTNYREMYKNLFIHPININLIINFQEDMSDYSFSRTIVINENDNITNIGKYILYILSQFSEGLLIGNKFKLDIYNGNDIKTCEVARWHLNHCLENINHNTTKIIVNMNVNDDTMGLAHTQRYFYKIIDYVKENFNKDIVIWPSLWL